MYEILQELSKLCLKLPYRGMHLSKANNKSELILHVFEERRHIITLYVRKRVRKEAFHHPNYILYIIKGINVRTTWKPRREVGEYFSATWPDKLAWSFKKIKIWNLTFIFP